MLTEEQMKGNIECYHKLTLGMIEDTLRSMSSEEELRPYRYLGKWPYKMPGYVLTNEKGLEEYLKELKK